MEERRSGMRYELWAQTSVKRGKVSHILDVKNISVSGILITTTEPSQIRTFHVDQTVELDITYTKHLENITVTGKIVRIQKQGDEFGIGIQFENISDEIKEQISKLVQVAFRLSGKPPMLPSDLVN